MEVYQNLKIILVSCLSRRLLYLRMYVFDLLQYGTYSTYIFREKILHFVTFKSDQDLDPDPHWLAPWIRIRIRIEIKSWIRIQLVRIHNTVFFLCFFLCHEISLSETGFYSE
jgi:hypothetical protein